MPASADLAILITAKDQASPVISGLHEKVGGMGGVMSAVAGAGMAAVAAGGLAIAGGLAASVTAAAGFESKMSAIKAVSGATGEEMATLQGLALKLGADTSFSAGEAADGIGELIKAGVSIGDVMGGAASASLSLAAAGAISVGDAAEIASNAMNAFSLKGADLGHVADIIAGAANASAIDVTDFKFSLSAVGAVANAVGLKFDDTAVAIAELGQAGIKGSDAGTSLKTMLMNLIPHSDKAANLMKELGIITKDGANQFFDATGKAKGMADIQQVLQDALKGQTEQQKLATLNTLFGSDAIRAAAVLAKAGAEGFDTMAESMGKVTAEAVAAERLNNLSGAFEQLKGSLETAAITLGLSLMPVLTTLTQWATDGVNAMIPMLDMAGKAIADLFSPDNVGAATIMIDGLVDGFQAMLPVIVDTFNAISAVALPVLAEVGGFIMETFGQVVSWFQENMPLIQQTIAVVVAAIAVLWQQHGQTIVTVIQAAWTIVKTVIQGAIDGVLSHLRFAMQVITGDWSGAWETLTGFIERQAERWVTILGAAGDAIFAVFDNISGGSLTRVGQWMSSTADSIASGMQAVSDAVSSGWQGVSDFVSGILPAIQSAIMSVWNAIPEDIRADLVLIAGHLVTSGAEWVSSVTTAGSNMLSAITAALGSMVSAVLTWAGEFLAPITGLVGTSTTAATSVGTGMLTAITTALGSIVSAVGSWVGQFLAPIQGLAGQAMSAAAAVGQAIVDGIKNAISSGIGAIKDMAYRAARAALDAAKDALGIHSPSAVFNFEVGRPIVQGLMAGVEAMRRPLDSQISGLVTPPPVPSYAGVGGGVGGGAPPGAITVQILGPVYGFNDFEDKVLAAINAANRRGRT